MSLLRSELRLRRLSLAGWTVAIALLALVLIAFYPSLRDNDSLDSVYADLPESAQSLLGGSDVTSPVGYLNTQLFAFFLPAVLLVFGIGRGSAALAGEEEGRTLDLLLAQPVPRWSAYLQKALAVVLGLAVLSLANLVPLLTFDEPVGFHLAVTNLVAICVQLGLFCTALALAAQAIGAATGRRSVGTAAVAGYAAVSYLVYGLAPSVSALEPLRPLSLWRWYLGNDPLTHGFGATELAVLVATCVVACAAGVLAFGRRDLRA